MLMDIVEVRVLEGYRVHVRFEDGVEGEVDLGHLIRFEGVFAPCVNSRSSVLHLSTPEIGTICWPNGADFGSRCFYAQISGQPIPTFGHRPATV